MRFDEFIQNTFASYTPESDSFDEKELSDLCGRLNKLPQERKFDNNFTLEPTAVKFKTRTVKLNQDISLSITEGINNQNEKIWAEKTESGKKLIVIVVPEVPGEFVVKDRAL